MIVLDRTELADVPLSWPTVTTSVLARGKVGTFVRDVVRAPDDHLLTREYLRHPGAVGVIALDEQERVALVRQYRHPVRHRLTEPPAGLLDVAGEDYLASARRELAEEAGLAAERWNVLVDVFTSPGMVGETLRVYLARDLSMVDAPEGFVLEGEEAHMDIVWAPLSVLAEAVLGGDLHNPTLVSGVLAAWAARERDAFASLRAADAPWPARDVVPPVG